MAEKVVNVPEKGDWDDSYILNMFNASIAAHSHRGDKLGAIMSEAERNMRQAIAKANSDDAEEAKTRPVGPSEWETCDPLPLESFAGANPAVDPGAAYTQSGVHQHLAQSRPTEAALSAMLMAWYQSGYQTGRYDALREMEMKAAPPAAAAAAAAVEEEEKETREEGEVIDDDSAEEQGEVDTQLNARKRALDSTFAGS